MQKYWVLCVLAGALAWGQAKPGTAPPAQTAPPQREADEAEAQEQAKTAASLPSTAAVITVKGVCPSPSRTTAAKGAATKTATAAKAESAPASDCKTVVTKAEFETLVKGAIPAPNPTPQMKKQLANMLPKLIVLSDDAKKEGLDKTPQFEEMMKVLRMQVLARELDRRLQEEAGKVPDQEIEAYYQKNPAEFEQFSLKRLFVPRAAVDQPRAVEPKPEDAKLSEEELKSKQAEEKARQEESEKAMTKLAEDLRNRAAAGESFETLQKEAFTAAGMKIENPTVSLPSIRRNGLQAAHAAVFDLKPGEVSQVLNDAGGHYIYKMENKTELPLDQVKGEIHAKLQSQRYRETMDKLNSSYQSELNEAYFGPGEATPPPGAGMSGPGMGRPVPQHHIPPQPQAEQPN
jgi:hypothetical protein